MVIGILNVKLPASIAVMLCLRLIQESAEARGEVSESAFLSILIIRLRALRGLLCFPIQD